MATARAGVRARLLLLVAAVVVPVTWSPGASAAPRPALAREVTLHGTGTGWVRVRLASPVTFARTGQPEVVRVSNPAAFAGVLLIREQRGNWPPGVGVLSLPKDGGVPFAPVFFGTERGTSADDDNPMIFRRTLAAGEYRLYLLARGTAKVSVTVRFPVRGGRGRFSVPRNTSHAEVTELSPGAPGTAVSPAHSHGGTRPVGRRALLLNLSWWSGDLSVRYTAGGCAYGGPTPDPSPAVPTCPNGPGASISGTEVTMPERRMSIGYLYVEPGRWLQKAYFAVGGAVRRAGIANYWLDLGAGYPPAG